MNKTFIYLYLFIYSIFLNQLLHNKLQWSSLLVHIKLALAHLLLQQQFQCNCNAVVELIIQGIKPELANGSCFW